MTLRILMLIGGVALGSVHQGCSPAAGYQRSEQQESERLSSLLSTSFELCWNKNTIVLGSQSSTGAGLHLPFGGGRGDGPFPLTVHATIMDSTLVEAGIREFGCLAGVDASGLEECRRSYSLHHHLNEYVFVYVEIQTFLAEEYLDADRWIYFVEDQRRNQIEPVRVVQHGIQRQAPWKGSAYEPNSQFTWLPVKRIVELYFPLGRFPPVDHTFEGFGTLKFVVVDINNSYLRAEGIWDLTTRK